MLCATDSTHSSSTDKCTMCFKLKPDTGSTIARSLALTGPLIVRSVAEMQSGSIFICWFVCLVWFVLLASAACFSSQVPPVSPSSSTLPRTTAVVVTFGLFFFFVFLVVSHTTFHTSSHSLFVCVFVCLSRPPCLLCYFCSLLEITTNSRRVSAPWTLPISITCRPPTLC